jgi:polyisoprenoid-binding protein YceI
MAKWNIDTAHASATFKVQHLGISWVRGQVFGMKGEVNYDPENIEATTFNGTLDVATVNSGNEMRDGHLKSPDFFDVANYPEIKFVSKSVSKVDENHAKVTGDLTIKDVTKEVVLDVEFHGINKRPSAIDPEGQERDVAAFSAKTNLNRNDYGLKWNMDLANGMVLVGNEVELFIEIEAGRA